jgi:hypothetical protein
MISVHVVAFALFDGETLQHPENLDRQKQIGRKQHGQGQIKIA